MYKPYQKPAATALPDVKLPEPRFSKLVVFLLRFLARPYLHFFIGSAKVVLHEGKPLLEAFKKALANESRCIIAFRHSNGAEPQLLSWFFLYKLKALAAKNKVYFSRRSHAVFVYGYEVARWGGLPARIMMPNIGAMPIHHAKMDSRGLTRIINAIANGPWPLALAPEGQVSYITDSVPRLEPGAIRIGFQAVSQLAAKNINIPVEILPLTLHFCYGKKSIAAMERLLRKIEKLCGFSGSTSGKTRSDGTAGSDSTASTARSTGKLSWTDRLRQCRDYILLLNEIRYGIKSDETLSFEERLDLVNNAALETAERMLGIKAEGDYFTRLYKVRQLCWDRIFIPELDDLKKVPQIKRSLLDLRAGEAWHIARHQELADFGWYFRVPIPCEDAALHNKIEYVQNLFDFANRSMGGAFSTRQLIFPKKVMIHPAQPINLTERYPQYQEHKKETIAACMADLEKAYTGCQKL